MPGPYTVPSRGEALPRPRAAYSARPGKKSRGQRPSSRRKVRRRLEVTLGRSASTMSAFLNWREAYEAGVAVCGGKGHNLARLARYGFRVPRGGVLPAGAPLSEIPHGIERLGLLET